MIASHDADGPAWLESVARIGHAAKGTVFASAGTLALWRSLEGGAGAGSGREAIRAIASTAPGTALVAILAAGLGAYVLWRLVQAILGTGGAGWGRRALYLLSAAIYAALTVFAIRLLLESGGEVGSRPGARMVEVMARPRGPILVGAIGAGLVLRAVLRLGRPREPSLDARSLELPAATSVLVSSVVRAADAARGIVPLLIGGGLVHAAAIRGPVPARPWMTALLGACLLALAAHEWLRVRYALPDP
jgi:hypothetical protein